MLVQARKFLPSGAAWLCRMMKIAAPTALQRGLHERTPVGAGATASRDAEVSKYPLSQLSPAAALVLGYLRIADSW